MIADIEKHKEKNELEQGKLLKRYEKRARRSSSRFRSVKTVLGIIVLIILTAAIIFLSAFLARSAMFRSDMTKGMENGTEIALLDRSVTVYSARDTMEDYMAPLAEIKNIGDDANIDTEDDSEQTVVVAPIDDVESDDNAEYVVSEDGDDDNDGDDGDNDSDTSEGEDNSAPTQDEVSVYATDIHGINISYECVEDEYDSVEYALSHIPMSILNALGKRGWTLHIIEDGIMDKTPFVDPTSHHDFITGLCWWPSKDMWVLADAPASVVAHEIGHAIDWETGASSGTHAWKIALDDVNERLHAREVARKILNDTLIGEVKSLYMLESIGSDNDGEPRQIYESFANAFSTYWLYPDTLMKQSPECFMYFAQRYGIHDIAPIFDPAVTRTELLVAYAKGREEEKNPGRIREPIVKHPGSASSFLDVIMEKLGGTISSNDDDLASAIRQYKENNGFDLSVTDGDNGDSEDKEEKRAVEKIADN